MPTITTIIPLYEGERYIEQSLRSVLDQDRASDQIIVVDDGSTDGGPELVRRIMRDAPTVTLLTKRNGGQASARNYGVRQSSGDLIAFLDQDDIWYPQHLRVLAEPFERSGHKIGWSYSNLDEIDLGGQMVRHGVLDFYTNEHPKRSLQACIGQDMHILPSASLISRAAFEAVDGFDEQFVGYEDDDLFLRIFRAGFKNVYISEPLSQWRMHATSASFSHRMGQSRRLYFRKLAIEYPDHPPMMRFYMRDLIAPRFAKTAFREMVQAVYSKDRQRIDLSGDQVNEFSQSLSGRRRVQYRLATAWLSTGFGRAVYRAMPGFVVRRVNLLFGI